MIVARARARDTEPGLQALSGALLSLRPSIAEVGAGMNEQPDAAHLILAKVLIGQLPRRTTTRCWVGEGQGLPCDGCDRPVTSSDLQHEVDAIGLGTLRFHSRCMRLGEEVSATPRDISGGSAPSPSTRVFDLSVARRAGRDSHPSRELHAASTERWALAAQVQALSGRAGVRVGDLLRRAIQLRRGATVLPRPAVRQPAMGGSYAAVLVAVGLTVATVWIARPVRDVGIREPSLPDRTATIRELPRSPVAKPTPRAPERLTARQTRSTRVAAGTQPVGVARVTSRRPAAASSRVSDRRGQAKVSPGHVKAWPVHIKASPVSARELVDQAP
jgi:hypothetical protein